MRKKSQQCLQEFEPEQLKEKDGEAQVHWEGGEGLERQITSVLDVTSLRYSRDTGSTHLEFKGVV